MCHKCWLFGAKKTTGKASAVEADADVDAGAADGSMKSD